MRAENEGKSSKRSTVDKVSWNTLKMATPSVADQVKKSKSCIEIYFARVNDTIIKLQQNI